MENLDLNKLLISLGTSTLSEIYGKEKLRIIVRTIKNSIDERQIVHLLYLKYGSQILSNVKLKTYLINNLPNKYANYVCNGTFENGKLADKEIIKASSTRWTRKTHINQRLVEVFGLSDDYLPPIKEQVSSIENIIPSKSLFHYQDRVKAKSLKLIRNGNNRFIINMPTGAGKTRTAIETLIDYWRTNKTKNTFVIWFAKNDELCAQAFSTLKDIWTYRGDQELKVYKLWGEFNPDSIDEGGIIITSFLKIHSMMKSKSDIIFEKIANIKRYAKAIVVDEAHQVIAPVYQSAVDYLINSKSSIIIGLTATPGRGWDDAENKRLSDYFNNKIVEITDDKDNQVEEPVRFLQSEGYLCKVVTDPLKIDNEIRLSENEIDKIRNGFDFSSNLLEKISNNEYRNLKILEKVRKYYLQNKSIIIFATSLSNSSLLCDMANILNIKSASIDKETDLQTRRKYISQFRAKELKVLFNYGVLTTGFDAPNTDVVVIARPTSSPVLYNQMIGRGIRGPKVGGNSECILVDVVDNIIGLPDESRTFSMYKSYYN